MTTLRWYQLSQTTVLGKRIEIIKKNELKVIFFSYNRFKVSIGFDINLFGYILLLFKDLELFKRISHFN